MIMALTLPCLSRAARAEQVLTASPKLLGRAMSWKFARTPTSTGAHFSPLCSRHAGFNNLDTVTPRALQDMAANRTGVAHRFLSSCSGGSALPLHRDMRPRREPVLSGAAAFFAPFSSESFCLGGQGLSVQHLPAATPKSLEDMVMPLASDRADSFCLGEQSDMAAAREDDSDIDMGCSADLHESHSAFLSRCKLPAGSANFVPFQAEMRAAGQEVATPRSLADMIGPTIEASSGRFCFDDGSITMPGALSTSAHFVPFCHQAFSDAQDSATPRSLADMVMLHNRQESRHRTREDSNAAFCEAVLPLASAPGAHFSSFGWAAAFDERCSATPKSMAEW